MKHALWARAAFFLLVAVVTWLTLTTDPKDIKAGFDLFDWLSGALFGRPELGDKLAHFAAYGALGFWSGPAQLKLFDRSWGVVGALALYGVALECAQHLVGVRNGSVLDALANALGAAAGFSAFLILMLLLRKRAAA